MQPHHLFSTTLWPWTHACLFTLLLGWHCQSYPVALTRKDTTTTFLEVLLPLVHLSRVSCTTQPILFPVQAPSSILLAPPRQDFPTALVCCPVVVPKRVEMASPHWQKRVLLSLSALLPPPGPHEILFRIGGLNLLSPDSGCPLQTGTGHGLPGRAPG